MLYQHDYALGHLTASSTSSLATSFSRNRAVVSEASPPELLLYVERFHPGEQNRLVYPDRQKPIIGFEPQLFLDFLRHIYISVKNLK